MYIVILCAIIYKVMTICLPQNQFWLFYFRKKLSIGELQLTKANKVKYCKFITNPDRALIHWTTFKTVSKEWPSHHRQIKFSITGGDNSNKRCLSNTAYNFKSTRKFGRSSRFFGGQHSSKNIKLHSSAVSQNYVIFPPKNSPVSRFPAKSPRRFP